MFRCTAATATKCHKSPWRILNWINMAEHIHQVARSRNNVGPGRLEFKSLLGHAVCQVILGCTLYQSDLPHRGQESHTALSALEEEQNKYITACCSPLSKVGLTFEKTLYKFELPSWWKLSHQARQGKAKWALATSKGSLNTAVCSSSWNGAALSQHHASWGCLLCLPFCMSLSITSVKNSGGSRNEIHTLVWSKWNYGLKSLTTSSFPSHSFSPAMYKWENELRLQFRYHPQQPIMRQWAYKLHQAVSMGFRSQHSSLTSNILQFRNHILTPAPPKNLHFFSGIPYIPRFRIVHFKMQR